MDDQSASERSGVHKQHLGGHIGTAHASATATGLNPRSCVTCRRRKVKCDKRQPCSNCTKQHIECIFPAPGRAPRRTRKPPDNELLQRLRKLEGVVKHLGATVDDPHTPPLPSHDGTPAHSSSRQASLSSPALDSNFGRLVISEGRSRYVNNSFWASLSNEVEDLKAIMDDQSDDEHDEPTPGSSQVDTPSHNGFMFGLKSLAHDLHDLHPPPDLLLKYWKIYEEHCDPLVKMLHLPSMRETIQAVKDNPGASPKGTEALLFAVYFATITSLTPEECLSLTGEDRKDLVIRFRFATEQALARAHFLTSEELTVLQAFVLFLICMRRHEDARVIWSLCGLVVRMAMTLGLHRDGSNFGLSPYDTEIRRRVWWQICILDVRASEDHGSEPTIIEHTFDTKFPLNVDDVDLKPGMLDLPPERMGVTEMTFSLIRFEVATTFRRLNYNPPPTAPCHEVYAQATLADKEGWIEQCHKRLEEKYLRYCDMNIPMHWVICTVSRLIMAKMWLIIYHPHQRLDGGASLPQETRDRLFITSLESIEYALLLETEVRTVKWGWLFRTYCQWHALAFLLSELCIRTRGITVQRAWRAVDATVVEWGGKVTGGQRSYLWRPLRKLIAKAREARERELASDRLLQAAPLVTHQTQQQAGFEAFGGVDLGQQALASVDANADDDFAAAFLGMTPGAPAATAQAASSGSGGLSVLSTDDGMATAASPFFANHPPIEPERWNTLAASGGADWLIPVDELDASYAGQDGDGLGVGDASEGGMLGVDTSRKCQGQGQGQGVQKPMVPWEDWDDMVQQFELEAGQAAPSGNNMPLQGGGGGLLSPGLGGSGAGAGMNGMMMGNTTGGGSGSVNGMGQGGTSGATWMGAGSGWGGPARRPPMMGETWL